MKQDKLLAFWQLARMDKPIGIYLLLWPTLWALWIAAEGIPPLWTLIVFLLGTVLMRAAGCVINDFADRKVDGAVKRTAQRPMATGRVTPKEAVWLFIAICLLAFALVLTLTTQTILLSFAGAALAFIYPFMKRFTHLPQFVLGMAFSWGIPMAFTAVTGELPWWSWIIYLANLLWTVAYDTQYAMVDRDDDVKIGIKSTAILFGRFDKLIIGILQVTTLLLLVALNQVIGGLFYSYIALAIAGILFIQHQWNIRHNDRDACFRSFISNHYVGMVIWAGYALDFALK